MDSPTLPPTPLAGPLTSHPPTMALAKRPTPPRRASTSSLLHCRICRSEATDSTPLFTPCKCSGSIAHVHQDCLLEWLAHSHKKHCELCKTPFRFTKLYAPDMPSELPWQVCVQQGVVALGRLGERSLRTVGVTAVWLGLLPWCVRWGWRWMFWIGDAGWATEMLLMRSLAEEEAGANLTSAVGHVISNSTDGPLAYQLLQDVYTGLRYILNASSTLPTPLNNTTVTTTNLTSFQQHPTSSTTSSSLLSAYPFLATPTRSPLLNSITLDVLEGLTITLVVIVAFIVVFLIREWVVQQQPGAFGLLGDLNNNPNHEHNHNHDHERNHDHARAENTDDTETIRLREANAALEAERGRLERYLRAMEKAIALLEAMQGEGLGEEVGEAGPGSFARYESLQARGRQNSFEDATTRETSTHQVNDSAFELVDRPAAPSGLPTISRPENTRSSPPADSTPNPPPNNLPQITHLTHLMHEADLAFRPSTRATPTPASWPPHVTHAPHVRSTRDAPITNAGPDAKINIQRSGRVGPARAVPEPGEERRRRGERVARLEGILGRLERAVEGRVGEEDGDGEEVSEGEGEEEVEGERNGEGEVQGESFGERVATALREEFGLEDEGEAAAEGQRPTAVVAVEQAQRIVAPTRPPVTEPRSRAHAVIDWFWGDIAITGDEPIADTAATTSEPEAVVDSNLDAEAIADREPLPLADLFPPLPADDNVVLALPPDPLPLDAEALEDAEDLEGVLELIGMQGPLLALLQTSTFCTILVIGTVVIAVGLPYVWGKTVLVFVGEPWIWGVQFPLAVVGWLGDILVDTVLSLGGWLFSLAARGNGIAVRGLGKAVPILAVWGGGVDGGWSERAELLAEKVSGAAGTRLWRVAENVIAETKDGLPWECTFLSGSMQALASLRKIEQEARWVGASAGYVVAAVAQTLSRAPEAGLRGSFAALTSAIPTHFSIAKTTLSHYTTTLVTALRALSSTSGILTITTRPSLPLDPSLLHWTPSARISATLTGYLALAALATLYVHLDTPLTRSASHQRTEKALRDSLRQAGGVLKVVLIISIEMLLFPLYCGVLLDIAFLPLFPGATLSGRFAWAVSSAAGETGTWSWGFGFVHWFLGTAYMFHFALFVGMCRKILRKGVLWFIRDPDDPNFHPVRDVLERNIGTQLRKIAFSALVYGALVILCLGGVVWGVDWAVPGVFPVRWRSVEPVLEFPGCLVVFNVVVPLVVRVGEPSERLREGLRMWLRFVARGLRLSHFLFGERRREEEGRSVGRAAWWARLWKRSASGDLAVEGTSEIEEERLIPDGKFVLTPCTDQYRPPKPQEAFLHYADDGTDDVYITDKHGKRNVQFETMYVPSFFRWRIAAFIVCLWVFAVAAGLSGGILPLVLGRRLLVLLGGRQGTNDVYAFTAGAWVMTGFVVAAYQVPLLWKAISDSEGQAKLDVGAWRRSLAEYTSRAAKCIYVYGFVGLALPMLCALLMQFYLVLPLHTLVASHTAHSGTPTPPSANETPSVPTDFLRAPTLPPAADYTHTIHLLSEYCLGLLYTRLLLRFIVTTPASLPAEAVRRITASGYTNPNPRLFTRWLVLPVFALSAVFLLFPPLLAKIALSTAPGLADEQRLKLYRYAFPMVAAWGVGGWGGVQVGKGVRRWRRRVRDEVYLVGEQLHNFGERRPPVGSWRVVEGVRGRRDGVVE